jgi:hypothetical protein
MVEKAKEKERGEVEEAGTSLTTLCPPEPSSSFLSQRVKAAIEKPAGGFAKNSSLRSRNCKISTPCLNQLKNFPLD